VAETLEVLLARAFAHTRMIMASSKSEQESLQVDKMSQVAMCHVQCRLQGWKEKGLFPWGREGGGPSMNLGRGGGRGELGGGRREGGLGG
jgi:hypothetical protein